MKGIQRNKRLKKRPDQARTFHSSITPIQTALEACNVAGVELSGKQARDGTQVCEKAKCQRRTRKVEQCDWFKLCRPFLFFFIDSRVHCFHLKAGWMKLSKKLKRCCLGCQILKYCYSVFNSFFLGQLLWTQWPMSRACRVQKGLSSGPQSHYSLALLWNGGGVNKVGVSRSCLIVPDRPACEAEKDQCDVSQFLTVHVLSLCFLAGVSESTCFFAVLVKPPISYLRCDFIEIDFVVQLTIRRSKVNT